MTAQDLVIGLDLGTSHCKALAVTRQGEVAAAASAGYPLLTPYPGQAEQSAQEVWQGAMRALRAVAAQTTPGQVRGLCLSGAMHNVLPVDAAGRPLAPALTWADQRAAAQAEALRARTDPAALYQRTGCPLQAVYHPAKLRWWLEEAPGLSRRAARFVALADYVRFQLSGEWAIDHSLASTTGLLDIRRLAWDEAALNLAGVSAGQLPPLVAPSAVIGRLSDAAAKAAGLPAGLPVVAGGSDGGLANLGVGALSPGQSVITIGTSGAIRYLVAQPWLDPAGRTWCYVLADGRWFAGGAINNGGLTLQWVRERFYRELTPEAGYRALFEDAAQVGPGAEGLLFLPYLTGERSPHWDPQARGALLGLALAHTRAHVARAALEGVAFCLADVWAALPAAKPAALPAAKPAALPAARPAASAEGATSAVTEQTVYLTGSVTRTPVWGQILADVLGMRLTATEAGDASTIGAALLGHYALGLRPGLWDPLPSRQAYQYVPDPQRHAFYREAHQRFQAAYRGRER